MSQQRLKSFLTKLDKELEKSSEDYRTSKANKKVTVFNYRASTIKKTLVYLLNRSEGFKEEGGALVLKRVSKELSKELSTLTGTLKEKFQDLANKSNGTIKVTLRRGGITATLEETEKGRDNFAAIQRQYKDALDTFYSNILETLGRPIIRESKSKGSVDVDTAGKAFNLEHTRKSSNVELFIADAVYEALKKEDNESIAIADIEDEIRAYKLDNIIKITKNAEKGTVELFIGSQIKNIKESAKEQKLKKDLQDKVKKALIKLDTGNLTGSDSLVGAARKKALKKIAKPFKDISKKRKNITVSFQDLSIKESKPESLRIKNKVEVTSKKKRPSAPKMSGKSIRAKKGVSSVPLHLIGVMNEQLPRVVQQNMDAPRLENRTGRFASSVQITDITTTSQGFPSIGYTYQKNPYQTFEQGFKQGSIERDPRKLIDTSIREVALLYAIGRFYTRRV
jgi:hypothetical protein